jgi:hypothetical protein
MTPDHIITAIYTSISLLGLWVLAFWLYRDYRVDIFREKMFSLRDELFDCARKGDIDFNDPAYAMLRTTMNGFIRFGDRLSFLSFILYPLLLGPELLAAALEKQRGDASFEARWKAHTGNLSPELRDKLETYRMRMHSLVAEQLLLSPLMLVAVVPVVAYLVMKAMGRELLRLVPRRRLFIERIDAAALAVGTV